MRRGEGGAVDSCALVGQTAPRPQADLAVNKRRTPRGHVGGLLLDEAGDVRDELEVVFAFRGGRPRGVAEDRHHIENVSA